jgi:toxin ParE1/3/4
MAYQLIWAPSACLDLKELAAYIAESRPKASVRFVKNVFHVVEHLADFPESGRVVPEFGDPSVREIIRRPCRIVYRVKSEEHIVEIARVWHAARGTPQL